MNDSYGRDQRDYIRFGRSASSPSFQRSSYNDTDGSFTGQNKLGRLPGRNRYGEENIQHSPHSEPGYRWSDDLRSEASGENHTGKGPKGYERSPAKIYEEACETLTQNNDLDASNIEVEVDGRILVLTGEVRTRYEKRLAEELIEDIAGIDDVFNRISVNKNTQGWIPGLKEVKESFSSGGENG